MTYGPLHPLFAAYIVFSLAYSLFLLRRKLRVLTGMQRVQVRYVFLAVFLPLLGGTITNLLIPLVLGSSRFSVYGPLFSILMVAVTAHAIIRYRLMNTRLVIRRGVVYLLTIFSAGGIFAALWSVATRVFEARPQDLPLSVGLGLVLLIAIAFQPLQRAIQTSLDRYLFREPYDYQRTIREISRTMAGLLDLHTLLRYACEAIARTVQPEHVSVYTIDAARSTYRRLLTHSTITLDTEPPEAPIDASAALIASLSPRTSALLAEDLRRRPPNQTNTLALDDMRRLRAEAILPLIEDEKVTGFFVIGPKLSADPYFREDVDLLATLVSQASVALRNAHLYSEVVLVNEYVENILATIESGVIATAADGRVTLFNSAAERLTGLSAGRVRSGSLDALPSALAQLLRATLFDKHARTQVETTIRGTGTRDTSIVCSTSPLRNSNGTMFGAVAVFSDLTRLKTLESEKRQAERLASIGALAAGIAHEIKNPLVAIKTFAELLPERFAEEDFRTDFAKVVNTEIERIDHLVARLRGLAAPSTRKMFPVDVKGPIEETAALLRGQLEHSRITLTVDLPAHLPNIPGDPDQLKQLFLNVLMNAVEAMEPGGEIIVHADTREVFGQRTVLVSISDTGPGIPEPLLGRIFDPFVTTKQRGSGLGLSICRGITDAHRATIRAENNKSGRGATIVLEFPTLQTAAAVPARTDS
jgi:PAS domain S-box-containing protein